MRTFLLLVLFLFLGAVCPAQFIYHNQQYVNLDVYPYSQEGTDLLLDGSDLIVAQIGQGEEFYLPGIFRMDSSFNYIQHANFPIQSSNGVYRARSLERCSNGSFVFSGSYNSSGTACGYAYLLDNEFNRLDSVFLEQAQVYERSHGIYMVQQAPNGRIYTLNGRENFATAPFQYPFVEIAELFNPSSEMQSLGYFMAEQYVQNITEFKVWDDSIAFVCGTAGAPNFHNTDVFLLKLNLMGDSLGIRYFGGPCSEGTASMARLNNGLLLLAYMRCIEYYLPDDFANLTSTMRMEMELQLIDPISFEVVGSRTYTHPLFESWVWGTGVLPTLATSDGGAVVLIAAGYPEEVIGRPMALKVDAEMNQEWFEAYYPENGDPFFSTFSNIVEWRDGYLTVGYMKNAADNHPSTWLATIDKCGKMENLGCYPQDVLSVQEGAASMLKVWPNPAVEEVQLSATQAVRFLRVWDTAGRMVLQVNNAAHFSVTDLDAGLYLLDVTFQSGERQGTSLIVQKP